MNIVVLNDFAYVEGGASKIALGSTKELAKRGHRVLLFTAVGPVDKSLHEIETLEVRCLQHREIIDDPNPMRATVRGLWNREAATQLLGSLAQFHPSDTVVHLHSWPKALSSSVIRVATDLGFPVLLTMHDYFSVCPAGTFFIHPEQRICHLKPMSGKCILTNCDSRSYAHKLWRVGRQWMQSHPGHLPSGIMDYISISDLSEKILVPYLPLGIQVHRVANFIDAEKGPIAEVRGNHLFSFAGRLSPEKGPQLLAECSNELDLEVQFIGDGPSRHKLAELAPRATFTGWLSSQDARTAIRRSRALVFPSLWYETQGLVVSEAAAMGVPAIVPSTSATCEWIEDGINGLVFESGNSSDLVRKIVFLRDNPEAAAALGLEAYLRYWKHPATITRHCEELELVYQQMLARNRTPQTISSVSALLGSDSFHPVET
jgi:glycosyltransferase involved in cell wall biosynthesis